MVGVALHRAGARHIILTDGNPEAVANCRRNLALNGVPLLSAPGEHDEALAPASGSGSRQLGPETLQGQQQRPGGQGWTECRQLCWEYGWPGPGAAQRARQAQRERQPTVVLGADLLYDPTVIPVLLGLLKQVLEAAAVAQAAADEPAGGCSAATQHAQHGQHPPAAYLATTLRNEATLRQFLTAAQADPDIAIQQLVPEAAPAGGSDSTAPAEAAVSSVQPGACLSPEPAPAVAGGAGDGAVRFQHLQELAAARSRIFLHRLTLSGSHSSARLRSGTRCPAPHPA